MAQRRMQETPVGAMLPAGNDAHGGRALSVDGALLAVRWSFVNGERERGGGDKGEG